MKNAAIAFFVLMSSASQVFGSTCQNPNEPLLDCRDGKSICYSEAASVVNQVSEFFLPMDGLNGIDLGLVGPDSIGCTLNARIKNDRW